MNTVSKIECKGWLKILEPVFNRLVLALNRRTIQIGAGLDSSETETGILIWSKSPTDQGSTNQGGTTVVQGSSSGGPTTGGWYTIILQDGACNKYALSVWAQGPPVPQ